MSTIILVSWCNMQSRVGYQLSVIKNGQEVFYQDRIGEDPGEAAAKALMYKARYRAQNIVADKKIMDIINASISSPGPQSPARSG